MASPCFSPLGTQRGIQDGSMRLVLVVSDIDGTTGPSTAERLESLRKTLSQSGWKITAKIPITSASEYVVCRLPQQKISSSAGSLSNRPRKELFLHLLTSHSSQAWTCPMEAR